MLRPFEKALDHLYKKYFYDPSLEDYLDPEHSAPVKLYDHIETASSEAIYRWDRLTSAGVFWQWRDNDLHRRVVRFNELENIIKAEHEQLITISLEEITLLSASKGDLRNAKSLEDFSKREEPKTIPSWLDEITEQQLKKMMSHNEIRIANNIVTSNSKSERLVRFSWHEGYALLNNGGSHHLAAAKYIAKRLPKEVLITGRCEHYSMSMFNIKLLNTVFDIFLVPKHKSIYPSIINFARDAKINFGFIETSIVANLQGDLVILPKTSPVAVADQFERCGFMNVGEYLYKTVTKTASAEGH